MNAPYRRTPRSHNKPLRVIHDVNELPFICDNAEAGLLLRVTPEKINRMALSGELPGVKYGGSWKFKREDLLAYFYGLFPSEVASIDRQNTETP